MNAPTAPAPKTFLSDIEIAQAATLRPIAKVARDALGLAPDDLIPYGHTKAKLSYAAVNRLAGKPEGKLILVTAISPTPAGEGKTTTTIGLGDALNRIGRKTVICLREPSLGPVFGQKGGATGGGYAQVVPMEDINLHFTGDLHAITAANNLLAAMIDNHLQWGNALDLDPRRITWRRAMDMNDRALRQMVIGLGGPAAGVPREDAFDITVASEVMAVFCLASDLADLRRRLGDMVIGETRARARVRVRDLGADGAMTALLRDAFQPNLVQTLEHNPALIHGGPFANIAHGCNSVMATRTGLRLGDYVVTEAGFGADLGAEKFFDIKCRSAGLAPSCAVLVATVRALKMHGGVAKEALAQENLAALQAGFTNLERHLTNLKRFGIPVVIAVNRFHTDSEAELGELAALCRARGAEAHVCEHWGKGGAGAEPLARAVAALCDQGQARFVPLYPESLGLWDKARLIAQTIYGAADLAADDSIRRRMAKLEKDGFGHLPVCIAKTQYSFSTDPSLRGAPSGHMVPVREVRLSAGAGFVVVVCGDIMTMPGLPRQPAALAIGVDADGRITGLF